MSQSRFKPLFSFCQKIKERTDAVYIMGYHGTVRPREILQFTDAKAVIRGEPEMTVLEICRDKKFSEIAGITFRKGEEIISNKDRELIDLDMLPAPAYHLFKGVSK